MKNTKNPPQGPSNTLTAVAAITCIVALAASVFFVPSPKRQAQASSELDLTTAAQICASTSSVATNYGDCHVMVETISALRTPPVPVSKFSPSYKSLSDCKEAVNYIFQDRVDYPRALKVVYRESTYNPLARRPGSQYAGCAQLSYTLQKTFLKGPWQDPFFNVLALRDAVDSPAWGWCHWDLVNYCLPGGEF